MESVTKDQIIDFLLGKHLISKHQRAFLGKHSTATNLLQCTHDWTVGISNSNNVDVVYIDFCYAFDSIVFSKLLTKIENCGITGKLLDWISAFVHNQTQCVVEQNCFSSVSDVVSGVPRGSV